MTVTIAPESPDARDARELIAELEAELTPRYPDESRHGYSVEKLIAEGVAFFLARKDEVPAGCGGVQLVDGAYGELKRMYVRPRFRGTGLATLILEHLSDHARREGMLRLETGIHQLAAIDFYERRGFRSIPPFGAYRDDPLSRFYEKRLS